MNLFFSISKYAKASKVKMERASSKMKGKKVDPKEVMTTDNASTKDKFNIDLPYMIRASQEYPSNRVKDESIEMHYVSKFSFKVNNTLLVIKVFLN